jgi:hypothetical protein
MCDSSPSQSDRIATLRRAAEALRSLSTLAEIEGESPLASELLDRAVEADRLADEAEAAAKGA